MSVTLTSTAWLTKSTPTPAPAKNAGFTLACWMYITANTNYWTPLVLTDGTDGAYFEHYATDSFMYLTLYLGGTADVWVFPAWTLSTWHHYAATWDGANIRIFVDGVYVSTRGSSLASAGNWTSILVGGGGTFGGAAHGLDGSVQDAVFYSAALADAEIAQLCFDRRPARRTNLLAQYPLDAGSAMRLRDYSGNGNDLTATGTPTDGTTCPRVPWGTGSPSIRRVVKNFAIPSTGTSNSVGAATVSSTSSLDPATGALQSIGNVTVNATAAIPSSSATQVTGAVDMPSTAFLVATGVSASSASIASLPSTSSIPAVGVSQSTGAAPFAIVLTPTGVAQTTGAVVIASASSAASVGTTAITGTANVAIGVAANGGAGSTATVGAAAVTSAAALVALGTSQAVGSATVPSAAAIVATGTLQTTGAATSGLAITGSTQSTGAATLTAAAPQAASGGTATVGAVAIASTAPIAALGIVQTTGASTSRASMSAGGTTQVSGIATITKFAGLGTYSIPRVHARHPAPIVRVRKLDR